jgi:hypothetical protein
MRLFTEVFPQSGRFTIESGLFLDVNRANVVKVNLANLVKAIASNLWLLEVIRSFIQRTIELQTYKTAGAVCSGDQSLSCEFIVNSRRKETNSIHAKCP